MTRTHYPKVALAAAIAALGFAAGTIAQTTATQSGSGPKSTDNKSTGAASGTTASTKDSAGGLKSGTSTTASGGASGSSTSGAAGKDAGGKSGGGLQGADRTFVMKAAQGGLAEVEAGKAAQQKAQNDAVKQFAQRMVTDHSKANEELMSLARSKNVDVPSALDKQHKAQMDKLNKLSGPSFDREYMKHMVDDHKKTVADFEKQAKGGKDAELKKWADSKLPTLREHLKMAQETHSQVGKAGGKSGDKSASAGGSGGDPKSSGKSDPSKAVNTANPTASTQGSNTGNVAGAPPKPATTGK